MKEKDFALDSESENFLLAVDDLVEAGINRVLAEKLVKYFQDWKNGPFKTCLDFFESIEDLEERVFVKAAMVGYLDAWVSERLLPSALAQTLTIQAFRERS